MFTARYFDNDKAAFEAAMEHAGALVRATRMRPGTQIRCSSGELIFICIKNDANQKTV